MKDPVIQIKGVTKRFKQTEALVDINLDITRGEFFSLLGPSGCGKTTLLRLIAGFEDPSEGEIILAGVKMSGMPPHKRPVNMVFQNYALFPHLTVFDNVAFGLRSRRLFNAEQIVNQVQEALRLVHLQELERRFPEQLSGGQQQRVALARAIVNRPDVLLLDEPLSALDSKIRQKMQDELASLHKELGLTFIMVTHDQGEALALSDRLAVFYQGRLQQVDEPKQIFEHPKTMFVADFVGHTNLLKASVEQVQAQLLQVNVHDALKLWVKNNTDLEVTAGASVTVWVRTQALGLSDVSSDLKTDTAIKTIAQPDQSESNKMNSFMAVIKQRSYQGASIVYYLEVDDKIDLRCSCPSAQMDGFAVGQKVIVNFYADAASVFPAEDLNSESWLEPLRGESHAANISA